MPHLGYGDVIYDQPNNDSFIGKIEQLQCKACLAITGAIQRTSRECLWNELGIESLSSRRWCRKLCAIYKRLSTQCPKYLFDIIPSSGSFCDTRKKETDTFFQLQNWLFQIFLFTKFSIWMIATCAGNTKLEVYCSFQKQISLFIRCSKRSICNFNEPEGVKYLTRLGLRFSQLNEHKFRHGFLDTLNPLCNCSLEIKDNEHFFLHCLIFENARRSFFIDITSIN